MYLTGKRCLSVFTCPVERVYILPRMLISRSKLTMTFIILMVFGGLFNLGGGS